MVTEPVFGRTVHPDHLGLHTSQCLRLHIAPMRFQMDTKERHPEPHIGKFRLLQVQMQAQTLSQIAVGFWYQR